MKNPVRRETIEVGRSMGIMTPRKTTATAGYSGKPLIEKLGIKDYMSVLVLSPPKNYFSLLGNMPEHVVLKKQKKAPLDFIHMFTSKKSDLMEEFPTLAIALAPKGMLWVSWPKSSSGAATDLNENVVRDIGLQTGLVDIKVAAIDEIWSGLKFVRRKSG